MIPFSEELQNPECEWQGQLTQETLPFVAKRLGTFLHGKPFTIITVKQHPGEWMDTPEIHQNQRLYSDKHGTLVPCHESGFYLHVTYGVFSVHNSEEDSDFPTSISFKNGNVTIFQYSSSGNYLIWMFVPDRPKV